MTLTDLLSRVASALERAQVRYMLTGSVASSAHGAPRSTRDLDIVIAPTRTELLRLIAEFPESAYYADRQQALAALANSSQFNIIDFATGWKVDFIVAEDSEYGRAAFGRRRLIDIAGTAVYVLSPEDVVIAKLSWSKRGASDRQLEDAAGILKAQGRNLELAYVERWVTELSLEKEWSAVGERL